MISLDDFKKQWRTLLVGIATVFGIGIALWVAGLIFGRGISGSAADGYAQVIDFVVAGTGALSGGTISVLIVQEAALGVGLTSIAVFPVLIAALQGLIGFPLTSIILRKEAARLRDEYRAGNLGPGRVESEEAAATTKLPDALRTTAGTLFVGRRRRAAQPRDQQPHQRRTQHVRRRPDLRHHAAHHGHLQAVRAGRHRRLRADDDRDHDPGVRPAGDSRAVRRAGPSPARCCWPSSSASPASPASPR